MVFDKSDIDGGYFIYNIYLPSNYSHNKEYALLVYMIFDDSMTRYPVHPYRIVREKSGDAIVLSFVTRWEYQWDYINEINIINVVNETLEKFNINRDRVYLIGICAGANRAFNLLCKIPDVFSAFINIAGTPIFDDKEPESLNLDNIRNTPIELLFTVNDMWYNVSAVINSLKPFTKLNSGYSMILSMKSLLTCLTVKIIELHYENTKLQFSEGCSIYNFRTGFL